MLTLKIFCGLKPNQGDLSSDLFHENIGKGENFYANMPKGFEQYLKTGRKKCLK